MFIHGKKYGDDADQSLSFPINCNFWALADALTSCKKANRLDSILLGSVVGSHPFKRIIFPGSNEHFPINKSVSFIDAFKEIP